MRPLTLAEFAFLLLCLSDQFIVSILYRVPVRNSELIDNLRKDRVVPDLIDHQPRHSVFVDYGNGNFARQGNELKMLEVKSAPRLFYPKAKKDKLYTIFMLDPDAPSREFPLLSPLLHYMVINAPRADNQAGGGETLVPYLGPSPPPGSGYHRYVFLVYEQKGPITNPSPMLPLISRLRFSLDKLPERSALIGPVAANFYLSQFSLK